MTTWWCFFQTSKPNWRACEICELEDSNGTRKLCGDNRWGEKAPYLCSKCWMSRCQHYYNRQCNCPECLQVQSQLSDANASNKTLQQSLWALEKKVDEMREEYQKVQDKLNWLKNKQDQLAEELTKNSDYVWTLYNFQSERTWFGNDGAQAWWSSDRWNSNTYPPMQK